MKINTVSRFTVSLLISLMVGCGVPTDSESFLSTCNERLVCATGQSRVAFTLQRNGSTCNLGPFALNGDNTFVGSGLRGQWTLSRTELRLCGMTAGDCVPCQRVMPAADPSINSQSSASTASGRCTGIGDSCSSASPGSCSLIRGCSLHSHTDWNGNWQNECEGSATSCSDIDSQNACRAQGCTWN